MYYVALVGRDYNLQVRPRAVAAATTVIFETRLETCTGPKVSSSCDITIDYSWTDISPGSGTGQVIIYSGSSDASATPSGVTLTSVTITNLTGTCADYNSLGACDSNLVPTTTTTTTTTTTSTTTTTTTAAPAGPPSAIFKVDQFSGSYSSGTSTWANKGTGGSTYNLIKDPSTIINTGGSGTGVYLGITGSLEAAAEDIYYVTGVRGTAPTLYNVSFSYNIVFRIENTNSAAQIGSIISDASLNGISLYLGRDNTSPYIETIFYRNSTESRTSRIRIPTTAKWYSYVLTYNKDAGGGSPNPATTYLNSQLYNFPSISSPSSYFQSATYSNTIGTTINPIKIAAVQFFSGVVLSASQIQGITNEYNSRYTLG
jgi:hypothetical protein